MKEAETCVGPDQENGSHIFVCSSKFRRFLKERTAETLETSPALTTQIFDTLLPYPLENARNPVLKPGPCTSLPTICRWMRGVWNSKSQVRSASERTGNTPKGFQDFYLKVKAIIWP